MYGLEAIYAVNGWAMAGTGAIIVFTGLSVLATVISQLHRILMFIDNIPELIKRKQPDISNKKVSIPDKPKTVEKDIISPYIPLIKELGDSFQLADLYRLSRQRDIIHPHITLTELRDRGVLVSKGDGLFSLKPE